MKNFFKKIIVKIIQKEASLVLKKYKPKIIAVTGSVGKTGTKDAIFTVMSSSFFVRKSAKSFNSEIGVPLTILGCPNAWNSVFLWIKNIFEGIALLVLPNRYPEWLVLEVGADRPGDIKDITKWLKPDIVVITRFSKTPVHVEFFSSPDQLIKEKSYLVSALKRDGVLVLNNDDTDAMSFKELSECKTLIYGIGEGSSVKTSDYKIIYKKRGRINVPSGINFNIENNSESAPLTIDGSIGFQHVYHCLAAFAVGLSQNLSLVKMAKAMANHDLPKGRMRLIEGIKDSTIIDDTYNSSPIALNEALETLKSIKTHGRKIAALGDMLELGKYSSDEHKNAGALAGSFCDFLITVGVRARYFVDGALNGGMSEKNIFQFENSKEAGKFLETWVDKGDIILSKGSQSMRMERIVEEVMAHPENKENLLVRQEEEWLKR